MPAAKRICLTAGASSPSPNPPRRREQRHPRPPTDRSTATPSPAPITGPQFLLEQCDRARTVGHVDRLVTPRTSHHRSLVHRADGPARSRGSAWSRPSAPRTVRSRRARPLILAPFRHFTEDRPRPARRTTSRPRHGHQRLDRGAHRIGVGVVRVVDDGHAIGPVPDLHAAGRHGRRAAEGRSDLIEGRTALECDGGRRERVADGVLAVTARVTGTGPGPRTSA